MYVKRCLCCRKIKSFRNKTQKYCSDRLCQNKRKRKWLKDKLCHDSDYREAQREASSRWRKKNPDYSRIYRKSHPEYVEQNRQRQQHRDRNKHVSNPLPYPDTAKSRCLSTLANSDVCAPPSSLISGAYFLTPFKDKALANSDAIIVQLDVIKDVINLANI